VVLAIGGAPPKRKPQAPQMIGDLGFMLGVEEECTDFFCQEAHLAILNYTFPPPAFHKGTILVNFTADYPGSETMFIGRTTAYDFATNRFFVITTMDGTGSNVYELYVIDLKKTPPGVTQLAMPQASHLGITAAAWDSVDKVLYVLFDIELYILDPTTGDLTRFGAISSNTELEVSLCTTYDSPSHNMWVAVYDDLAGTHHLLTYNTRTKNSSITPPLNNGDVWSLYAIQYYAKNDTMIALTDHYPLGYPSIKILDYHTGLHVDLVPEYIWGDYDYDYSLWPLSSITSGTVWLDPELNIFWLTVEYLDPETLAFDDALVYYNLSKLGVEMGSGPMVIWENAIEFTNYVWYNWNTPF